MGGGHDLSKDERKEEGSELREPWVTRFGWEREGLLLDSGPQGLDFPPKHPLHQSRKPAYRGTRTPGRQGPPRAGRPAPGWGRRRGDGRRALPAAVHTPGSSCNRPTPGAPPVGIGVGARDRYTVLGTAGHTPAETETSLSHGRSRWLVSPSQLTPSLPV